MARRILITGASVAGVTAAWWLGRAGADVTVVERAPAFREGGQNVDVRGIGRDVLRRMGLEEAALAAGTGEEGTAFVDGAGVPVARFPRGGSAGDGLTAELEILRGDLARLIHEGARGHAAFRYGDSIAALQQDASGVDITFAGGNHARYDLVIVAEGVGSTTRDLVLPGENRPRWMDLAIAFFTIPRVPGDDRLWRWYQAGGGRSLSLRPDRKGTTRAMLTLQQPPGGEQDWDPDRQKAMLRTRFADAGWEAPRILEAMRHTGDFYFDVLRQNRLGRWSDGRVVLTGDAAWCATPIAGIGTTLAVAGAYVLAGELSRSGPDPGDALAAYERIMRPLVTEAQGIPKIAPRLMNPHSRIGVRLLRGALALAARPAVQSIAQRTFGRRPDRQRLPSYP